MEWIKKNIGCLLFWVLFVPSIWLFFPLLNDKTRLDIILFLMALLFFAIFQTQKGINKKLDTLLANTAITYLYIKNPDQQEKKGTE